MLSFLDSARILLPLEYILDLLITLFIVDGLVYQARYLWNDIRGASEDQKHPSSKKRRRLPVDSLGFERAVYIALAVMWLRLAAAVACILLMGPDKWFPLMISCAWGTFRPHG